MTEKRQHPRIPVALTVTYASRGDLKQDLATDLSPGGLFVRTNNPLPVGTDIDLSVVVGPTGLRISINGTVTWRRENEPHRGMGIQFGGILGPVLSDMVEETKRDRGLAK
jgi:uncharacterized protein (TIGR02266 family)